MPRKITDKEELHVLIRSDQVGFNHFMGGSSTPKDGMELMSVGSGDYLFSAEEMEAIRKYLELELEQQEEAKEFMQQHGENG